MSVATSAFRETHTQPRPTAWLRLGLVSALCASLWLVQTPVHAATPAKKTPVPAKKTLTVEKARGIAKAACASAEPLISPFAAAVTRFSQSVKASTQEGFAALRSQLVELEASANAPNQATAAATQAYGRFATLANRRRTISHKDLAIAARFKAVRFAMRKATKELAAAAAVLLAPPPAPPAPKKP